MWLCEFQAKHYNDSCKYPFIDQKFLKALSLQFIG